ncbi:MAG: CinA family protein [Muribaculum sp.]|nr:CinA family protein [Muribaculum sp.]
MKATSNTEKRHVIVYGYTRKEIAGVLKHFIRHLPEYIRMSIESNLLVSKIILIGKHDGIALLRFNLNRYQQNLRDIFTKDVISSEDKSLAEVLGDLLKERELTVACAESCTGGNIAHRITQQPGSSNYFLGSVVSYANDVKTNVLGVPQTFIDQYGAVSRQVVESMAEGVCRLMRSDCAISTSGIAGPDGGTKLKPVGTVWIGAKYGSKIVSECRHFEGDRNDVIESATAHGIVMLINLLRDTYEEEDDLADE